MVKEITKDIIIKMVDDMIQNPEYDDKGKIDSGWVSMHKLRVDTYLKMLNDNENDININIEI